MKEIKIECDVKDFVEYKNLTPFQGNLKNLSKENYQKLKSAILKEGFSAPLFVWKSDKKYFILDGHQRLRTIQTMVEQEKYICPPLPIVKINAKSFKQAKKKLLLFASQFGEVNSQGLYELIMESNFDDFEEVLNDIHFADIKMDKFKTEFFQEYLDDIDDLTKSNGSEMHGDQYILTIHLKSEQDLQVLFEEMKERGIECKIIT